MVYIVGFVFMVVFTAAFSACAAMLLRHYAPKLTERRRRRLAPAIGALMTVSPAIYAAIRSGTGGAVISVLVIALVLALIAGYPAMRWFEGPPGR